jgi:four helix bundle protein
MIATNCARTKFEVWNLESGIWNIMGGLFLISRWRLTPMRYKRFEDLPVWNEAIDLAVQVYAITSRVEFRAFRSLRDQLERATVSVSNNIAEGFERGTNNELLAFLYIARGSAGEVRSMLCLLQRIPAFKQLNPEISKLKQKAESCSRQLKGWTQSLQNSDFKGERYVSQKNETTRASGSRTRGILEGTRGNQGERVWS